jgi:hypothetical protein
VGSTVFGCCEYNYECARLELVSTHCTEKSKEVKATRRICPLQLSGWQVYEDAVSDCGLYSVYLREWIEYRGLEG